MLWRLSPATNKEAKVGFRWAQTKFPPRHYKAEKVFMRYKGKVLRSSKIEEIARDAGLRGADSIARHHGNYGESGCPCCRTDERLFHEVERGVYSVIVPVPVEGP
jgi:hypothetical protein